MATTRFETTLNAIKGGLKNYSVEKGVQNIEGWEDYLSKHDHEGVKKVLGDLGKLKKLLQAKQIDSDAIRTLLGKLGKDTVAVAGKDENANAKHIRDLGEALSSAADSQDDDALGAESDDSGSSKKSAAHSKAGEGASDEEITHAEQATKGTHTKSSK